MVVNDYFVIYWQVANLLIFTTPTCLMSDTRNYRLVYPDPRTNEKEPSGGYVDVHISHDAQETQLNIETAIVLARLSYQVRLRTSTA